MTQDKYSKLLKRFIIRNFDSYFEAAQSFSCSPTTVSLVLQNERSPNRLMLEATGHERVEGKVSYVRVK
jgi:hypothetical protein